MSAADSWFKFFGWILGTQVLTDKLCTTARKACDNQEREQERNTPKIEPSQPARFDLVELELSNWKRRLSCHRVLPYSGHKQTSGHLDTSYARTHNLTVSLQCYVHCTSCTCTEYTSTLSFVPFTLYCRHCTALLLWPLYIWSPLWTDENLSPMLYSLG